jgi:RES domain-containing protein
MTPDFILTPPPIGPRRYGPLCCQDCFEYEWIREYVENKSQQRGECDFCESTDVPVVEVSVLSGPFLNLTSMYSPVGSDNTNFNLMNVLEAGDLLDRLIQHDWEVFSDELEGQDGVIDLLEAILNARYTNAEWASRQREVQEHKFDRLELYTSRKNPVNYTMADAWEEHRLKIIDTGGAEPFGMTPEALGRAEATMPAGSIIYRARNGYISTKVSPHFYQKEPYPAGEIGAPPVSKASVGRANRAGQVVLYVADREETAVAEVRPARGFLVTIGEFRTKRELRLLDLIKELPTINPFTDPALSDTIELYSLFHAFAIDLSTPLDRGDDTSTYLPSQSLTDAVRGAGFNGIRYPSAMHPGESNIVLFDPTDVEFMSSRLVKITAVGIKFELVDDF